VPEITDTTKCLQYYLSILHNQIYGKKNKITDLCRGAESAVKMKNFPEREKFIEKFPRLGKSKKEFLCLSMYICKKKGIESELLHI
jgi:hypothetical protein